MKSKLKFIFYVLLFSFISASCSFLLEPDIDTTMVTINLSNLSNSPVSHSITDDEKAAAKFDIYINGALATKSTSSSFVVEAKVGEIINIRVEAFVDGSRIASGENTITVAQGNNVVYIVLLEDRETPEPQPEPEPEPTVKYTVSYELADGTWNPASPPVTEEYSAGAIVTIISNEPTKQDYTFDGWRAVPGTLNPVDGNLRGGGTFTMPASNVTLTAQWTSSGYDVIEISTVVQLKEYAEKMQNGTSVQYPNGKTVPANTANYRLMADLNLQGQGSISLSASGQHSFSGDFDGNGHKLMNLNNSSKPLFHDVDSGGIIRNLILENVNINSDFGNQSPFALTMNGTLIGCQVSGTITSRYSKYALATGSGSVAGCLASIDSNSVNNLCGGQADVYGAAFSTASSPIDLNEKIRQWNNLPDVQNDSRLKCDWHFVDASTGGVALERGAP